ncbi:beta-lactamase Bla2 family protein [Leptospira wolbachii serovar Codice str. CDC]|uniref:beta-lactamase n=2 Tax=Leptospira TaxID=171 RepID=R9A0K6_9LEPT|nr:beta-lactamase Bla2 family protein [Leptospira wolbachii serovar Codice str. CDC]
MDSARTRYTQTFLSLQAQIRFYFLFLTFCLGFSFSHCHFHKDSDRIPAPVSPELGPQKTNPIEWIKIKESVWMHRSYGESGGKVYPANGLVILTNKGAVVIDTPWTESQTEELFSDIQSKFQKQVLYGIVTHAHNDRISGVPFFQKQNIPVYSTNLTAKLAKERGFGNPNPILDIQTRLGAGNQSVEVFYPGHGHSVDNIVVWLPDTHILFGGCLVKSLDAKDLGYIQEANMEEWEISLKKVLARYPDAEVVVPGHGDWGKLDLLRHTIRLLVAANN